MVVPVNSRVAVATAVRVGGAVVDVATSGDLDGGKGVDVVGTGVPLASLHAPNAAATRVKIASAIREGLKEL